MTVFKYSFLNNILISNIINNIVIIKFLEKHLSWKFFSPDTSWLDGRIARQVKENKIADILQVI